MGYLCQTREEPGYKIENVEYLTVRVLERTGRLTTVQAR